MLRSTAATLGFAGGVTLGLAVGFLLFGDGRIREGAASGQGGGTTLAIPANPEPAPLAEAAPASPPTPIETRGYAESASWIVDSVAVPEAEAGDGVITGTVTTDDGTPLAGAVVRAARRRKSTRPSRHRRGDPAPPDGDLRTRVLELVESQERSRADRREATSDEHGAFRLTGLSEDPYSVEAYLEGYELTAGRSRSSRRIKAGQVVEFLAVPVITLAVDVRMPDGSPATEATLYWKTDRNGRSETWQPQAPELRLTPGAFTIHAASEDECLCSDAEELLLEAGAEPPPLNLALHSRTGLRGQVRPPPGSKENGMQVRALRYTGGTPPERVRLQREGKRSWAGDHDGFKFRFLDLEPGTYLLGAGAGEVEHTLTVQVPEGVLVEQDIVLPEPDPNEGLIVWVEGPDGAVLKDAEVSLGHPRSFMSRGGQVRKRGDGSFLVTLKAPRRDLPPRFKEENVLTVSSRRFGEKIVPHPGEGAPELRVRLDEPASLEVTLAGYAGSGLEGRLNLHLIDATLNSESTRFFGFMDQTPIGSDGHRTFAPIQSGAYVLRLMSTTGGIGRQSPISEQPVTVGPGRNTATITVPTLHTLTVVFGAEFVGQHASLNSRGEKRSPFWGAAEQIGESGEVLFSGLPAGTYILSVNGFSGGGSMVVTVPTTSRLRFQAAKVTALRITGDDDSGTLASLGLLPGDLITGVDGADFDGTRPADQVLRGLMLAKKSLTLRIQRDGKPLQLTLDTTKLQKATRGSNRLDPVYR